jgi:hypothetical protein
MNESQLIALIITALTQGLSARGIRGIDISQDYQPTLQGQVTGPSISLSKVAQRRYGFLNRVDSFNVATNQMIHTETQLMITTFQINAQVNTDPTTSKIDNPLGLTAGDYLQQAVSVLQSDYTRWWLKNNGVAVERVVEGRVTYFKDEKQTYEADPSYDCAFEWNYVFTFVTPSTPTVIGTIDVIEV